MVHCLTLFSQLQIQEKMEKKLCRKVHCHPKLGLNHTWASRRPGMRFSRVITSCPVVAVMSLSVNMLLDKIYHPFSAAKHEYAQMMGTSLWPSLFWSPRTLLGSCHGCWQGGSASGRSAHHLCCRAWLSVSRTSSYSMQTAELLLKLTSRSISVSGLSGNASGRTYVAPGDI